MEETAIVDRPSVAASLPIGRRRALLQEGHQYWRIRQNVVEPNYLLWKSSKGVRGL